MVEQFQCEEGSIVKQEGTKQRLSFILRNQGIHVKRRGPLRKMA